MPAGVNPAGINFQFCHMFSARAEILSPKRGDVMQSFVCGTRLCFGADAPAYKTVSSVNGGNPGEAVNGTYGTLTLNADARRE